VVKFIRKIHRGGDNHEKMPVNNTTVINSNFFMVVSSPVYFSYKLNHRDHREKSQKTP
jgi:hypothetical protein